MASPKIGKSKEGKKVSMLSITELKSYSARGGKDGKIAAKELRKRGVNLEDVVL